MARRYEKKTVVALFINIPLVERFITYNLHLYVSEDN